MVKFLDRRAEKDIVEAIRSAEHRTSGEIRVHVRGHCRGDVLEAAKKMFHRIRLHRTKHRNAVLIFVALESRQFAILGDRAIHEKVGDLFWKETRDRMASYFSKGQIKEGIVAGVMSAGEKLKTHFPLKKDDTNELSDKVTED